MGEQNKNLILASVLSFIVITVWFWLFPAPQEPPIQDQSSAVSQGLASAPKSSTAGMAATQEQMLSENTPRIKIDTPSLEGSISLIGGRIDELKLKKYKQTIAKDSPIVQLLIPANEQYAFYGLFGWGPANGLDYADVPGPNTQWELVSSGEFSSSNPIVLEWENDIGLRFTRTMSVDQNYMFTITQTVENNGAETVNLFPYGIVARHSKPENLQNYFISHEGVVERIDGTLIETDYGSLEDLSYIQREGANAGLQEAAIDGWIGFTDKYWMAVLIPEQGKPFTAVSKYVPNANIYQTETRLPVVSVAPGASTSSKSRFFAGAKEWEILKSYMEGSETPAVPGFIDAIDWGWFFFLTKPIFLLLHWLNQVIGNMGLSIIALTFIIKIMVLPLAYKSYVSMARMKELQPEMEALKAKAGDDKQLMQREVMKLYREKKVNPAAGCLPVLIQIPIFFSLYKVIFVTIELRQAPFIGWIKDLSQPDPSSIINLFGILPWAAPPPGTLLALVFIGLFPILLGISMWLQQKLNPTPTDKMQQQIFGLMPWVFMFMLGGFASGLVLYWITNNVITFSQQYMIMRSHGHTPDVFENIKKSFSKSTEKGK